MMDDDPDSRSDALRVLRNEYKSFVLAALAQMHLLPFSTDDGNAASMEPRERNMA